MRFVPYFQTATVLIFLSVIAVKALMLRRRNITAIVVGRGKSGTQLFFELYSFGGFFVWIAESLLYSFGAPFTIFPANAHILVFDGPVTDVIGAVIVAIGLFFFISAFISFGESWRVGFDLKSPGRLVTTGVFAFSRNPIYLFVDLWFLGVFLMNGTLVFLVFALLAIAHLHYQMMREERFCSNLYGAEYDQYRARVGRYFSIPGNT